MNKKLELYFFGTGVGAYVSTKEPVANDNGRLQYAPGADGSSICEAGLRAFGLPTGLAYRKQIIRVQGTITTIDIAEYQIKLAYSPLRSAAKKAKGGKKKTKGKRAS